MEIWNLLDSVAVVDIFVLRQMRGVRAGVSQLHLVAGMECHKVRPLDDRRSDGGIRAHALINAYDKAVHSTKHVLQLASLIGARPLRVLDFGCGKGEFLTMCHRYGLEAFGVDRSQARRNRAGVRVVESVDCSGISDIVSRQDYDNIHPLEHINGFTPATLRSIAERLGFESVAKPLSHVTASRVKAAKTEARRMLLRVIPATTQQYFRLP